MPAVLTDYDRLGLTLNLDRVRWARSLEVARGINIALGSAPLPRAYFDGICWDPAEVEDVEAEVNAQRQSVAAMAKAGL